MLWASLWLWLHLCCTRCAVTSHLAPNVTVPVNNNVDNALISYPDAFPVVTVVPFSPLLNNAVLALTEWGAAVRVLHITKLATRSLNQACLVSLLAHIKPLHCHPHDPPLSDPSLSDPFLSLIFPFRLGPK